jgi:hypothetical protein
VSGVFNWLTRVGSGNVPTFDTMMSALLNTGPGALVDLAVLTRPALCSSLPGGLRIDFGSSYTRQGGGTLGGRVDVTYSNVQSTSSTFSANLAAAGTLLVDGRVSPFTSLSGSLAAVKQGDGTVKADITIGSGASPAAGAVAALGTEFASISGTAHFDTALCTRYPISGSLSISLDGTVTTVTFDDRCRGAFAFSSSSARSLYYWVLGKGCADDYQDKVNLAISMLADNGALFIDPSIPTYGTAENVHGTVTPTTVAFTFDVRDYCSVSGRPRRSVIGSYSGSKTVAATSFTGKTHYTITWFDCGTGAAQCSVERNADSQSLSY